MAPFFSTKHLLFVGRNFWDLLVNNNIISYPLSDLSNELPGLISVLFTRLIWNTLICFLLDLLWSTLNLFQGQYLFIKVTRVKMWNINLVRRLIDCVAINIILVLSSLKSNLSIINLLLCYMRLDSNNILACMINKMVTNQGMNTIAHNKKLSFCRSSRTWWPVVSNAALRSKVASLDFPRSMLSRISLWIFSSRAIVNNSGL